MTNLFFSHPDFTVGFGISPNQPKGSRTLTAGREFHPAPKNKYLIVDLSITLLANFVNDLSDYLTKNLYSAAPFSAS